MITRKAKIFIKTFIFLTFYILGVFYFPPWVKKGWHVLSGAETISVDFGRFLTRLTSFLTAIILYWFMECVIAKKSVKETVFFQNKSPIKSFSLGAMAGGGIALLMIFIAIFFGALTVNAITDDYSTILRTILLYTCFMLLTATSEELAFRGFALNQLKEVMCSHRAIFALSVIFGLAHFPSPSCALEAFIAALILGYAFLLYGIYYVIGWHCCFNLVEISFFSGRLVTYQINNVWLAGNQQESPPQVGFLSFPILLIALILYFLKFQKKQRPLKP